MSYVRVFSTDPIAAEAGALDIYSAIDVAALVRILDCLFILFSIYTLHLLYKYKLYALQLHKLSSSKVETRPESPTEVWSWFKSLLSLGFFFFLLSK